MLTVTVRGLGLNVTTLPNSIFELMQDLGANNEGAVSFQIEEASLRTVEEVIRTAVAVPVQINRVGTSIVTSISISAPPNICI